MSSEIADIEARDAALKDAQERERLSMQGEPGIPDGEWVYAASQAEKDRRTLLQRIRELETENARLNMEMAAYRQGCTPKDAAAMLAVVDALQAEKDRRAPELSLLRGGVTAFDRKGEP